LGTVYPAIVTDVLRLAEATDPAGHPVFANGLQLVIDGTGVGRPVVDLFRREPALAGTIRPVLITAGHSVSFDRDTGYIHVAKKELVGSLKALMQSARLRVARSLPDADALLKELLNFKVKITAAGNETFESWRERDHDELVLSLAAACWWGERYRPTRPAEPRLLTPDWTPPGAPPGRFGGW
jgi:hypothetical protein